MQFIFLSLAFAPVIVTAVDFLEDTNLFSEHASSPVSLDDWDSTDLLDYNENSELNMFVGNDVLDSNISAEKDCTTPPVSGLIGRIRGRTDQCSSSLGAAPQLQLPTLDDLPLTGDDGLVLDSLKNEEICSSLVFPLRNIPICGSGNPLDRKYIARDSGYSLEHCTLCMFSIFFLHS